MGQLLPGTTEGAYVLSLWQKLLEAYIIPNGPREVNIPANVRDSLIALAYTDVPPEPSVLDVAVQKVYELMEESVLVPFLNSFYPQTALPDSANTSPSMMASPPSSAPAVNNRASAPSSFSHF